MNRRTLKHNEIKASMGSTDEDEDEGDSFQFEQKKSDNKSKTPVLDTFGKDLNKMAEEGKLDPIIGRDKEIERVSQILSRRKKNNPVLIGEPGVGKTSIVEGLALRITNKKVNRLLFNKRIVILDLAAMVAGTKYRGQFEERIKALLKEIENNKNIILFIDEIHTLIGAGGASGTLDASNIFKPALARGDLQIIGATTINEYRKYIEKDGALERRFQKVLVEPPTVEETIEILYKIKEKYEDFHNVIYTDEAIKSCVYLSDRYINDRFLPDKAIDILDEAGSSSNVIDVDVPQNILDLENKLLEIKKNKIEVIKLQRYEDAAKLRDTEKKLMLELEEMKNKWEEECKKNKKIITENEIARTLSTMTNIPVFKITQNEYDKLSKMYDVITNKIIDQDDAVRKVVNCIQRNRIGLRDINKPIGVFMFLGPTGVGKTQLAKEIAKYLFDSEDSLIRIDMSEYIEKHTVSKLIGAPPGYVGYDEGGQLTEKIRHKPYSVVLLDEIEKAHSDLFNLLLQVFDDGHLTDSFGRKVNFKNTIIIMTSNVGSKELKEFGNPIGFQTKNKNDINNYTYEKTIIEKALKNKFSPEFLNRIDDIVIFKSLNKESIKKIINIEIEKLVERVKNINYDIEISERVIDFIANVGFDPEYGARPLKRSIQKHIEDVLTQYIIQNNPDKGTKFFIDYDENNDSTFVRVIKKRRSYK